MVKNMVGGAKDVGHLTVLGKAQVVAGESVRRIVMRCSLLNKEPSEITHDEIMEFVQEEDRRDEARGEQGQGGPA